MKSLETIAKKRLLLAGIMAAVVALVGAKVYADDASDIEQFYPVSSYVTYDNTSGAYPIITAVGSMPGVIGGHTYTGWSVLAQDSTGSLDLFTSASTLTTLTHNASAALHVGDALNVGGSWSPFDQIPELAFTTVAASNDYFTTVSTGNATPTPPVFTVSQINVTPVSNHVEFAGFYLELANVTITGSNGETVLPGYTNGLAQETFTVTDNTGSMTLFDWTTSYSAAEMLTGTPIGASIHYNVYGFVDEFGTTPEFTPFAVTAVPEPSSVALVGMGVAALFFVRRRRS